MIAEPPVSLASDPVRTRGRLHKTDDSPTRSEFQRDRDRVIHSTAFRRLQHKTQVFLAHEGTHFRTRLTHTLEVSQIARAISRSLGLNEDLAEAVALTHDLGHTPFGHAGERALHRCMEGADGFDHNMQAIRVVTQIENRYAEHDGLNLTWEVIEGILKHNGPMTDAAGNPVGRYRDHGLPFGIHDEIAAADLMLHTHASLEAQAAAIADDLAYNAHDVDDALRAGLLALDDLIEAPLIGPIVEEVRERYPNVAVKRQGHEVIRRLITRTIENVIATSAARIADAGITTADQARHAGRTLIGFDIEMAEREKELKSFLFARVYRHDDVMRHVRVAEEIVERLFRSYAGGDPMPGRWGEAFNRSSGTARLRVVSDFVAGMTDPFALSEYTRLFDLRPDFG